MSDGRTRAILLALPGAATRALPRLTALDRHELLLLLQAPVALPCVALALHRWGLTRVQRRLLRGGGGSGSRRPLQDRLAAARRVAWCVQVSAAYSPWRANCLHRSVVLCWFLHRRGLQGELRFGVRPTEAGGLDFHAWVEYDGVVLNDAADVRSRYALFTPAASVTGGPGWTG